MFGLQSRLIANYLKQQRITLTRFSTVITYKSVNIKQSAEKAIFQLGFVNLNLCSLFLGHRTQRR